MPRSDALRPTTEPRSSGTAGGSRHFRPFLLCVARPCAALHPRRSLRRLGCSKAKINFEFADYEEDTDAEVARIARQCRADGCSAGQGERSAQSPPLACTRGACGAIGAVPAADSCLSRLYAAPQVVGPRA